MKANRTNKIIGLLGAALFFAMSAPTARAAPDEGMVGYRENAVQTPRFSLWDTTGGTFGAETVGALSATNTFQYVVVKESPTRNEMAMAVEDNTGDILVQIWDGETWGNAVEVSTAANANYRGFDMAYEQVSGDLIIAYYDGVAGSISYNRWDGAAWIGEAVYDDPLAAQVVWIKMKALAGSDNIVIGMVNSTPRTMAAIWDGGTNTFGNASTLGATNHVALATGLAKFDVDWEQLGGAPVIVYADTDNTNRDLEFWRFTAGAWGKAGNQPNDADGTVQSIRIASCAGTDYIGVIDLDSASDVDVHIWDAATLTWPDEMEVTNSADGITASEVNDIAFEQTTCDGLAVYAENQDAPRYRTWTLAGGWSGEGSANDPDTGTGNDPGVFRLVPKAASNEIMMLVIDQGGRLGAEIWDGGAWADANGGATLEATVGSAVFWGADFDYHYPPTITVSKAGAQPATLAAGSAANIVGTFTATTGAGTKYGKITQLVVTDTGTITANTELTNVGLWWDNDGTWDGAGDELLISGGKAFAGEAVTFNNLNIWSTQTIYFYIVFDVAITAPAGASIILSIAADGDVTSPNAYVTGAPQTFSTINIPGLGFNQDFTSGSAGVFVYGSDIISAVGGGPMAYSSMINGDFYSVPKPINMDTDPAGNIFVALQDMAKIKTFTSNGQYTTGTGEAAGHLGSIGGYDGAGCGKFVSLYDVSVWDDPADADSIADQVYVSFGPSGDGTGEDVQCYNVDEGCWNDGTCCGNQGELTGAARPAVHNGCGAAWKDGGTLGVGIDLANGSCAASYNLGMGAGTDGKLYVATAGDDVCIFNANGTEATTPKINTAVANLPWDVAVDSQNNVIVTNCYTGTVGQSPIGDTNCGDNGAGRLQKYNVNGTLLNDIAITDSVGQPARCWGVNMDKHGNIYTACYPYAPGASYFVARIGDYGLPLNSATGTKALNMMGWFGTFGTGDGQFNNPMGIAVDPEGNWIWVSDYNNNRLQKFILTYNTLIDTITIGAATPTVTMAVLSGTPVTMVGADAYSKSGAVTFEITFSKAMNTAATPTITFTTVNAVEFTITQTSYSGNTWIGTATVPDYTNGLCGAGTAPSICDGMAKISIQDAYDASGTVITPNPDNITNSPTKSYLTFVIDSTAPTPPTITTPDNDTSTTLSIIPVGGTSEANATVRVTRTTFACIARDLDSDDVYDLTDTQVHGACVASDMLQPFGSKEKYYDFDGDSRYDDGEWIIQDTGTASGAYDATDRTLLSGLGGQTPTPGDTLTEFDSDEKVKIDDYQDTTADSSGNFYANDMNVAMGDNYFAARAIDYLGNVGNWTTYRTKITRVLDDPGTAVITPSNDTMVGSVGQWTVRYTAISTFSAASCVALDDCYVTIDIPSGWTAPTLTSGLAGYVTASAGSGTTLKTAPDTVSISGQTIRVNVTSMRSGSYFDVIYGTTNPPGAIVSETATLGLNSFFMTAIINATAAQNVTPPKINVVGYPVKISHIADLPAVVYDSQPDVKAMTLLFHNTTTDKTAEITGLRFTFVNTGTARTPPEMITRAVVKDLATTYLDEYDISGNSAGTVLSLNIPAGREIVIGPGAQRSVFIYFDFASNLSSLGITGFQVLLDANADVYFGTSNSLTDSALTLATGTWTTNSLLGYFLIPNAGTQPTKTYTVTGNTGTTISVKDGDMTSWAASGNSYTVGNADTDVIARDQTAQVFLRSVPDDGDTFYPDNGGTNPQMTSGSSGAPQPPAVAQHIKMTTFGQGWNPTSEKLSKGQTGSKPIIYGFKIYDQLLATGFDYNPAAGAPDNTRLYVDDANVFSNQTIYLGDSTSREIVTITGKNTGVTPNYLTISAAASRAYTVAAGANVLRVGASASVAGESISVWDCHTTGTIVCNDTVNDLLSPGGPNTIVSRMALRQSGSLSYFTNDSTMESSGSTVSLDTLLNPIYLTSTDYSLNVDLLFDVLCSPGFPDCSTGTSETYMKAGVMKPSAIRTDTFQYLAANCAACATVTVTDTNDYPVASRVLIGDDSGSEWKTVLSVNSGAKTVTFTSATTGSYTTAASAYLTRTKIAGTFPQNSYVAQIMNHSSVSVTDVDVTDDALCPSAIAYGQPFTVDVFVQNTVSPGPLALIQPDSTDLKFMYNGVTDKTSEFTVTPVTADTPLLAGQTATITYTVVQDMGTTTADCANYFTTNTAANKPYALDGNDYSDSDPMAVNVDSDGDPTPPQEPSVSSALAYVRAYPVTPATPGAGATNVEIMNFKITDAAGGPAGENILTLRMTSRNTSDADVSAVKFWEDTNDNGYFESGIDTVKGSTTFTGGYATFTFVPTYPAVPSASSQRFFVTYDIATTATDGDTIDADISVNGMTLSDTPNFTVPPSEMNSAGTSTINIVANRIYLSPTSAGSCPNAEKVITITAVDTYGNRDTSSSQYVSIAIDNSGRATSTTFTSACFNPPACGAAPQSSVAGNLSSGMATVNVTDTVSETIIITPSSSLATNSTATINFAGGMCMSARGVTATTPPAGQANVLVIDIKLINGSGSASTITQMNVNNTGTAAATEVSKVHLYYDSNNNATFNAGVDTELDGTGKAYTGSTATFNFSLAVPDGTTEYFFVTNDVATGSVTDGHTLDAQLPIMGLTYTNPATLYLDDIVTDSPGYSTINIAANTIRLTPSHNIEYITAVCNACTTVSIADASIFTASSSVSMESAAGATDILTIQSIDTSGSPDTVTFMAATTGNYPAGTSFLRNFSGNTANLTARAEDSYGNLATQLTEGSQQVQKVCNLNAYVSSTALVGGLTGGQVTTGDLTSGLAVTAFTDNVCRSETVTITSASTLTNNATATINFAGNILFDVQPPTPSTFDIPVSCTSSATPKLDNITGEDDCAGIRYMKFACADTVAAFAGARWIEFIPAQMNLDVCCNCSGDPQDIGCQFNVLTGSTYDPNTSTWYANAASGCTAGDGTKNVYVQLKDGNTNVSDVPGAIGDSVIYDSNAPAITSFSISSNNEPYFYGTSDFGPCDAAASIDGSSATLPTDCPLWFNNLATEGDGQIVTVLVNYNEPGATSTFSLSAAFGSPLQSIDNVTVGNGLSRSLTYTIAAAATSTVVDATIQDTCGNVAAERLSFTADNSDPSLPTLAGYSSSTKTVTLTDWGWYNYASPYFEWATATEQPPGAAQVYNAGLRDYYYIFSSGTGDVPDHYLTSTSTNVTATTTLVTGNTYYYKVRGIDNVNNIPASSTFNYRYDATAPDNPAVTGYSGSGATNTVTTNTWYTYSNPHFTWAAATDLPAAPANSGISGYVLYWGTDSAGTPGYATTGTAFTSTATLVAGYTYYLRMLTQDNAGNATSASTAFTYKYDPTPPDNPTVTGYSGSGATNTIVTSAWYNYSNPHFTWAAATDLPAAPANSGFSQFVLYWGTDSAGAPGYATTGTAFTSTATLVAGYTYYLRMTSQDNAGNSTGTTTVFTYEYDPAPPNNPTATAYSNSAATNTLTTDTWYTYANPHFTWAAVTDLPAAPANSGFAQCILYWGTDSAGTPNYATTGAAFTSTATLVSSNTYYLRVKCEDAVGNATSVSTLFAYKYDPNPPTFAYNSHTAGGSTSWYSADPGNIFDIDLVWVDASPLASYYYQIGSGAWTSIWSGSQASNYTTDWGVTWASLSEGASQISLTGFDTAGNGGTDTFATGSAGVLYRKDVSAPNNPAVPVNGYATAGKLIAIADGSADDYNAPYFEWAAPSDNPAGLNSGVSGYVVGISTDPAYVPVDFQTAASYTAPVLTCGTDYYLRIKTADSAVPPSTSAVVTAFTYQVVPQVVIINGQAGDNTWRGSNTGTYDVDFYDSCAFDLDYVQYTLWSATGMGTGTGTQQVAYTTFLGPAYPSSSYTANWGISAAAFSAAADGVNYVSVRAYNDNGLFSVGTDAFYILKDTVKPNNPATATAYNSYATATAVTLASGTWYSYTQPYFEWSAPADNPSPLNSGVSQYVVYFGTDSAGTPNYATSTTGYWASAALVSGYTYYLRLSAQDAVGNLATPTTLFSYYYDSTPPNNPAVPVSGWATSGKLIAIASGSQYLYTAPYFEWTAPSDLPAAPANSGVRGYLVAFSTDPAYDPTVFQTAATYTATTAACSSNYYLRIKTADSSTPPATSAAVTAFTYIVEPTIDIIDNQAGDNTWRNTNSGTYDVDFVDSCNFDLDYTQYTIWSAANRGSGTGSLLFNWATFVGPGYTFSSYTTNWSLSAAAWAAATDGINWVSVEAYDVTAITAMATDVFYFLKDTLAPSMPTVSGFNNIGLGTALADNSWYNYANPHFTWAAASDLPAGLNAGFQDYVIYFGTDSAGTPTYSTTSLNFTSTGTLVAGYTYYLRMSTRDNLNNTATASTVFTYKYDPTAPDNPAVTGYSGSGATNTVTTGNWYNYSNPHFTWAAATDLPAAPANSGIAQYVLFWGTDSAGTPNYATTGAAFTSTSTLVAGYTYYLRMYTQDNAGNATSASTVYTYKYDPTPPDNPAVTGYSGSGATNTVTTGNWYNYSNPHFTWAAATDLPAAPANSGVAQYILYWGTDSAGTPGYATTGTALTSTTTLVAGYTYYLRMSTQDNAGNATGATTVYTYKYDPAPPDNPAVTAYPSIAMATTLTNNTWYSYANPHFTWAAVTDLPAAPASSGLNQYVIYFGTDSAGVPTYGTTSANFTSTGTLTSGYDYYLRMFVTDNAGNATSAITTFTYRYDSTAPNNPAVPVNGWSDVTLATAIADSGSYPYSSPVFRWAAPADLPAAPANSGVAGYLVSFSTDAADVPTVFQATDTYSAATITVCNVNYYLRLRTSDNALTPSTSTTVTGFTYLRSGNASAVDNQAGDNTWRSTNVATYDVDFSGACSANIDYVQYTIWSAANMGSGTGTQLLAYTTFLGPSLGVPIYTTNWSLSAGAWAAATDGINWVTVKVVDINGEIAVATDAFYLLKDTVPPDNPTVAAYDTSAKAASLASGSWYNYTAPYFEWTAVVDKPTALNSGTKQYTIYFGTDSAGVPSYATTATSYTATQTLVSGYTYYLRMFTQDNMDNATSTTQTFVYKFDSTPPNNPAVTAYNNIGLGTTLTDSVWYNYANPHFTWAAVSDLPAAPASSGVNQYVIYFGTNATGTPDYGTTTTAYTSTATLTTGYTYYLRMFVTDTAGNATSAITTFTYKYDSTPPDNPAVTGYNSFAKTSTLTDGSWYGYANPHFEWAGATDLPVAPANSGMRNYNIYFGTDSSGAPNIATTAAAFTSTQTLTSGTIYYLRMSADDNANNATGVTTVYTFKYDITAPNNPAPFASGWATDGKLVVLPNPANEVYGNPYFEWAAPSDLPAGTNAGVGYYYIGFSTDPDFNPTATQSAAHYYATPTQCGATYTLVIKTADAAIPANVAATTSKMFTYHFTGSLPIITDNQTGDDTWHPTDPGAIYNVDFQALCNPIDYAQYTIYSGPNYTGTQLKPWTNLIGPGYAGEAPGFNPYISLANWGIDWSLAAEGINYISVRTTDTGGDTSTDTDVFYVKKDTIKPTISAGAFSEANNYFWVSPANGKLYYGTSMAAPQSFTISGTATDTTTGNQASGLATATFSLAFDDTPSDDTTPATWSGGYDISSTQTTATDVLVTLYDSAGNYSTASYSTVKNNSLSITYATISKDWRPSYTVFNLYYPDGVTEMTATSTAGGVASNWLNVYSVANASVTWQFTTNAIGYNPASCELTTAANQWCVTFLAAQCTSPSDDMHHISLTGTSTADGFITTLAEEKSTAGDLADGTFQATNGPDYITVKPEWDGLVTADTVIPSTAWCSGAGAPCYCPGSYCTASSSAVVTSPVIMYSRPDFLKFNNGATNTVLTLRSSAAAPTAPATMEWSYDSDDYRIIMFDNPATAAVSYTPASGSELVCAYLYDACDSMINYGKWMNAPIVLTMDASYAPGSGADFTENNNGSTQGFSSYFAGLPGDTSLRANGQTSLKGYMKNGKACVTVTAANLPTDSPATPIKIDATYIDVDSLATGTVGLQGGLSSPGMILIRPSEGVPSASGTATSSAPAIATVTTIWNPSPASGSQTITLNPVWNFGGTKLTFISMQSNPCAGSAAAGDGPYNDFNVFTMEYTGGSWTNCVRVTRNTTDGSNTYGPSPYSEVAWSPSDDKIIFTAADLGYTGLDKLYWTSATSSAGAATASQYNYVAADPAQVFDTLASNAVLGASVATLSSSAAGFATGEQVIVGEYDVTTNAYGKMEIKTISAINTVTNQVTFTTPLAQTILSSSGNIEGRVQYPVTLKDLNQTVSPMDDNSTWYDPNWSPKDAAVGCAFPPDPATSKFGDSLMVIREPGVTGEDVTGVPNGSGVYPSSGNNKKPNIIMFYGNKNGDGVYQSGKSSIFKITDFAGGTIYPLKPKWSPDCSKIAFLAWDRAGGLSPAKTSIYVINLTDARAGWNVASLPVTSLTATGVYQVYSYAAGANGTPNLPAYFPNWSADGQIVSYSVDVTNTFDLANTASANSDYVRNMFYTVDFDSYMEYIEDQPASLGGIVAPQLIGRELGGAGERNEFGMAQCPGKLTGAACPGGSSNPVYTYITQNSANSGSLKTLSITSQSNVTSNGGLLFLDGIVTAVFPPGVISSDTVFSNDWPTMYCTGAAASEFAGGGAGNCPVEPTGEFIVKSGDARNFFPDGTAFNGYVRLIFHYCDNDNDGKIDTGTEGTQVAGFTYNSLTSRCQIGGVNTSTGTVDVDSLAVYNWLDASSQWVKMQGTVDKTNKTISVYSTHFSRYDTFGFRGAGQPALITPLQLSNIHTYPNPWQTLDGSALKFAADAALGDGPISVVISVHDIRGVKVGEIRNVVNKAGAAYPTDPTAGVTGSPVVLASWNATNLSGRPLASGVYLYYLDATDLVNGTKVTTTGKLSIIH